MKDKLVVIHQPDFMPYLGFFQRLVTADVYIVLDQVQFVRGSSKALTNRDKIKTAEGEKWIHVGIKKAPFRSCINEIQLSKENSWRERSLNLIKENYRKAPYFDEIYPFIQELYSLECEKMIDFNMASIRMLMSLFYIEDTEIIYASELQAEGKSNELVVNLVKAAGCSRYLSGTGARNYFIPEVYERAGVEVIWQKFEHPIYPQQFGEFIPYLSSFVLLLNCGRERSSEIIRNC